MVAVPWVEKMRKKVGKTVIRELLMQDFKCMMVNEFVDIVVTKLVK